MIPTRDQIHDVTNFFHTHLRAADYESTRVILEWMKRAALEKLDAMPFQPGEVVVNKDGTEVFVTDATPDDPYRQFSGVCMKPGGLTPLGRHYCNWYVEKFTRKTTNS
jgi:hypothetical protein